MRLEAARSLEAQGRASTPRRRKWQSAAIASLAAHKARRAVKPAPVPAASGDQVGAWFVGTHETSRNKRDVPRRLATSTPAALPSGGDADVGVNEASTSGNRSRHEGAVDTADKRRRWRRLRSALTRHLRRGQPTDRAAEALLEH